MNAIVSTPRRPSRHERLVARVMALVGPGGNVVLNPNVTFALTPSIAEMVCAAFETGGVSMIVHLRGSRADGSHIDVPIYGMRQFYRMLKPPTVEAQRRYLRLWHIHAMRLAKTRGGRYAVKDEVVFCHDGHPIGLVRQHVVNEDRLPERMVLWRLPESRTTPWRTANPQRCLWCGTEDIRARREFGGDNVQSLAVDGWYMVDGVR